VLIRDSPLVLGGLVALIGVRRDRPWVFGALTYGLTTVLLTTLAYHVESRYLSGLLPIGAMTIGGALAPLIERAFDALRAKRSHGGAYHLDIRARRFAEVSGIAACAALTFVRTVVIARTFGTMRPTENSCTRAAEIIKREAASTSRVLTTNPWLVSWLADRPAIMAPTNGPNAMQAVLEYYKPEWILSTPHLYGGLNLPVELERLRETGTIDARLVFEGKQCSVYRLESATDDQSSEDL